MRLEASEVKQTCREAAERAESLLDAYSAMVSLADDPDALLTDERYGTPALMMRDVLVDLMHLAAFNHVDFEQVTKDALRQFHAMRAAWL